jgi:peptidoglycan hydrolase CwlO-like protein
MHEVTGMSIRDLRDLMGDRRTKYRLSDAQGRPKPEEKAAKEAAAAQAAQQQAQQPAQASEQQNSEASKSGNYAH